MGRPSISVELTSESNLEVPSTLYEIQIYFLCGESIQTQPSKQLKILQWKLERNMLTTPCNQKECTLIAHMITILMRMMITRLRSKVIWKCCTPNTKTKKMKKKK